MGLLKINLAELSIVILFSQLTRFPLLVFCWFLMIFLSKSHLYFAFVVTVNLSRLKLIRYLSGLCSCFWSAEINNIVGVYN